MKRGIGGSCKGNAGGSVFFEISVSFLCGIAPSAGMITNFAGRTVIYRVHRLDFPDCLIEFN
jgi:hypothetical protein